MIVEKIDGSIAGQELSNSMRSSNLRRYHCNNYVEIVCFLAVVMMVFFFSCSLLFAATYYVSPTGNDNNPGSDLKPFLTLQKAANLTLPGDVVIAKNGVYTSTGDAVLKIDRAGSSSSYITFKSENPQGAIIDGRSCVTPYCILLWSTAAYIKIEGFDIRYAESAGIYGWGNSLTGEGSHDIFITNNNIHHNGKITVTESMSQVGKSGFNSQPLIHHYTFEGNTIHDNGRLSDSFQEHAYRHDHGLYLQGKYITVKNNIFYNHTAGWAIKVDGYWGTEVGNSENSHVIVGNTFKPEIRSDPNGGGYIRFYNNESTHLTYGTMKPPKNILIDSNSFYKPAGPSTDSAIVIDNAPNSNFSGTLLKSNITTSSHLYSEDIGASIRANVTAIDNTLNAADSMFAPKIPAGIKIVN